MGFLTGIWAKITAGFAIITGILLYKLKTERLKRKLLEYEAETNKANREIYDAMRDIDTVIQIKKAEEEKELTETRKRIDEKMQDLQNMDEFDDDSYIIGVARLLNQDRDEIKSGKDT